MYVMTRLIESFTKVAKHNPFLVGSYLMAIAGLSVWLLFTMDNNESIITGKVQTVDGQSVVEARVYFISSPVALPDIAALTDTSGEFSLSVPVAGTYQIGCTADGLVSTTVSVSVKAGQNTNIEIRLEK